VTEAPDSPVAEAISEFRARAASWLERERPPHVPENFLESAAVLRDWQRKLYDANWLGLSWDEEYGGQGMTLAEHVAFVEEMVRAGAPMPLGVLGLEIIGPTIIHFGTEEQKRRYLPPLLRGDEIWCQGFSEPDAGSDLASLKTTALLDGDEFVVNGQKVWTSHAQLADLCGLLVRTNTDVPKHKGISFLLVPMDVPGITVRPIHQMTGSVEFSEVFFDDVRVPASNLLGHLDGGWNVAMTTLSYERGPYTLRRNAEVRLAWQQLTAALKAQTVSDPHVLRAYGRAEILVEALNAICRRTLADTLAGRIGPRGSIDKLVIAEVEAAVFGLAVDLLGPFAMHDGHRSLDAPRWAREYMMGRAAGIYGGTTQVQRTIVAERVLGLPRAAS
jgi:alkylation response protein AidB-like acyl-CoA dehydrogenase